MIKTGYRPVTIATITGASDNVEAHFTLIERLAAQHPDLVLLSENWTRHGIETIDSPVIQRLKKIAAENRVYILHATMLHDGDRLYNTALMFGRDGELVGRYDKIFPYYEPKPTEDSIEWYLRPHDFESVPGPETQPLIECDFGKVAVRTCFDANFPETWKDAADQGAELMLFTSAYAAGRQLEAHALNYHYPIVTASRSGHCMVIDIDGKRVLDTRGRHNTLETHFITLDLDRCIFHQNFNDYKLDELLKENPPRVELERHDEEAQWMLVRSACDGVSAREVCREAGMEELLNYKNRTRRILNELRPE